MNQTGIYRNMPNLKISNTEAVVVEILVYLMLLPTHLGFKKDSLPG